MGKRLLAAGVAMAVVVSGQPAFAAVDEPAALVQPDPMLAFLPDLTKVDWAAVSRNRAERAKTRAQQRDTRATAPPLWYHEREAVGARGTNDSPAAAETVPGFGTRRGRNPRVTLTGDLAPDTTVATRPPVAEDNGAIPLAGDTGVPASHRAVRTSGTIGDGPHGSGGDRTGDYDFYRLSGGASGATATIETSTPAGALDTVIAVYDATGKLLVVNDNAGAGGTDSRLHVPLAGGTDYFVLVSAAGPAMLPADPMKSGSGNGVGTEGPYELTLGIGEGNGDKDFFAVQLRAGDVLGASAAGGATRVVIHDSAGREVFGSSQDLSSTYPAQSPLPGGGNAVADFVAPQDGRYTVGVERGAGRYDVTVEAYRPGTEVEPRNTVQTLFLDFDGARVNTKIFGGPGVRQLSPLSAFLSRWGLGARDENAVIDAVVATVRENIERDLAAKGVNPRFAMRILNSRDHADPFGKPDVSRVVVGGTMAESGIATVAIAQSIDPGNFGHEETTLVLLDLLSDPAGPPVSLNTYVTPASNRIAYIGRAVGNIAAHETGHITGNWHHDQFNDVPSLMDQGGNPKIMFAVGPDNIGGTADDLDVDFTEDAIVANEGFTGTEDTVSRSAWAYSRGTA